MSSSPSSRRLTTDQRSAPVRRLRLRRWALAPAAAVLLLAVLPAAAAGAATTGEDLAEGSPAVSERPLESLIDEVMEDHVDRFGLAGASVTVVRDGEVSLSKGYGYADVGDRRPVDADTTVFPMASVAKLFTWTAVMQLVESGQLDLEDPVNDHLTTFQIDDTFAEPVRVWHLLSHTAGFEDRPVVSAFSRTADDLPDLESALVRLMPERAWEPGRYTAYSNYSTALAAHLVAEVSGTGWADYLQRHIFDPLGMTRTSARQPVPPALAADVATVYARRDGELTESFFEYSVLAPAGGVVTTTGDMGRFMLAHLQGGRLGDVRILEEATVEQMHSRLFTHDARLPGNAHGLWESIEHGQRVLSHGGDLNTAHTLLAMVPERDLGVYVAYNSAGGAEARAELWTALWDHALADDAPAAARPAAVSGASLVHLTGDYGVNRVSTSTMAKLFKLLSVMTVSADGGELVTEVPGIESQRWAPVGDGEFAEVGGPGRMVFGQGDDGAVTHVVFNGSSMSAFSPLIAFFPVAWYDSPALHAALLGVSVVVVLTALVGWPILALVRRRRGTTATSGEHSARRWAALAGGLFLGFMVLLAISLLDVSVIEYGIPAVLWAALATGVVAAVLTVGSVFHAVQAWRHGYWRLAGRLHHALVTLACLTLTWQLYHWNLLGVHA